MIWLWMYLVVGLVFLARAGFNMEFLEVRTWTELRVGRPPVEHVNERAWKEWAVATIVHLIFWPVLATLLALMLVNVASGWLLSKL